MRKRRITFRLNAALFVALISLLGYTSAARAADDTARFFGQWKTTVHNNGQTITIISIHDANGYRNYVLTPTGFVFAGSGAYSAANGIWMAAAPAPNNGGTYHFVDSNTVIASNAVGQTVTWRRDDTPLPGVAAPSSAPETSASETTAPQPRPSDRDSTASARTQEKRGLIAEPPADQGDSGPGNNFALVIGIDDYAAPLPKLKTAVNDAKSIAALLSNKYGFQVITLLDQNATRDKILDAIAHYRKSLAENDSFLIYYAGHGSYDRTTDKGY